MAQQTVRTGRQTARKTEQQTAREKNRQTEQPEASAAFQALLAGASLEQVPAAAVMELSHEMGNQALLELISHRGRGPELFPYHPPEHAAETPPLELDAVPAFTPVPMEGGYAAGE